MSDTHASLPHAEDFLVGGGEMGERMRAMDWSKTAVGPISSWPQSLRTAVSICLLSRFPLWIGWGPDLVHFYNDACRPIFMAKHPGALGRRALDVWSEVKELIDPMLAGVLARGEATWSTDQFMLLERNGYVEETYFTFSYSPIRDESGGVGGVLTAVHEMTEQVVGERRLRALRELGARTLSATSAEEASLLAAQVMAQGAADLPFALIYLTDGHGAARLEQAIGLPESAELQRSLGAMAPWPFKRVVASGKAELVSSLPVELGAAGQALVLPLRSSDEAHPAGFLVAGISPRRPFDDGYRGFLELVAGSLASAIAKARAYQEERRRAEALARIDRAKTAFFSNVSHELRTPLTLILGPTEDAFSARELIARVSTQLQIAELRRAAEREREQMFALFEQAPVAIAVLRGQSHVFELANPRCQEIAAKRDLVGRAFLDVFPELGGTPILGILERVSATGEPFVATEFRVEIDRGRGLMEAYFDFNLHPVRDMGDAEGRVLCVVNDITEQVSARRRLEEATKERERLLLREQEARCEAESANRAKDEFLAMLGHELRNPLAPITTALHLMRLRYEGVAVRERTVIERQVKHLTRLVDDLLDVSRVTQGKIELSRRRIEVSEIVAKAIELASPLLEQRRHHLTIAVPERGLAVFGDATRLAQAVSNLLANAAKYTENEGRIEVEASCEGGMVVLKVRDNGIGIDPEVRPKVFDLFVQERQALDRSQGGLGLGLAIVRTLVAMHGGSVSAHSEGQGKGSEFTIRLPAAEREGSEAAPGVAKGPTKPLPSSTPRGGRRILVVDDNQDAAELLAESLSALGHATQVAHDALSALQIAETMVPEVALLDIGLPVMDGYELARRLREQPSLEKLCLIAVTGYGQTEDRRRSREAGFDAHLVKPVQLDRLRSLLAEFGPQHP